MSKVTVEIKKKTIQKAWNHFKFMNDMAFTQMEKGTPFYDLMREIEKSIKKKKKEKDFTWKDLFEFWPLSIVVPIMLLSIILGPLFQ